MIIAVRCIYRLSVTPNFMIIDFKGDDWSKFLHADNKERIEIIRPYIKKPGPSDIAEIAWIPLDGLRDSELMELELACKHLMRHPISGDDEQHQEAASDKIIASSILINLKNFKEIRKMHFLRSYPFALDKKKGVLIVMNQHHNYSKIQDKIKSFTSVRNIKFDSDKESVYHVLYDFCKGQIIKNLANKENIPKLIEFANGPGMCRYYYCLQCYRNLHGIDAETYERLNFEELK